MHYYKILKHKAGFDEGTNYWEKILARYLAATGGGKILTTLPITFTSTSWKLAGWTIYGNNHEHSYTAEGTLPLTFTTHTAGAADDWVIEGNDDVGENLINVADFTVGVSETHNVFSEILPAGTYTAAVYQNTALTSAERNTLVILKTSGAIYESASTNYHLAADWHYLTFTIAESENVNLRYWTVNASNSVNCTSVMLVKDSTAPDHYIPYQQGVGERTAQLLNCATFEAGHLNTDGTISSTSGVTSVVGGNGSIELTLRTPWRGAHCDYINVSEFEQVYFNYSGATNNNQWRFCFYDATQTFVSQETKSGRTYFSLTVPNSAKYLRISIQLSSATTYTFTSVSLMAGSTAPTTFVPYAYQIPITVSQDGQTDKTYDIFIGDSPLTAGQQVSKASTGVDIELFEGENTVSTTLYNKPETSITYTDYLGVGEYVNGQWQIPLTVTHYTDNIFDKDAKNTNKGYEDGVCIMWAGSIHYPYMTGNEDNNYFVSEKIPASPNTTYYLTDGIFKNTDNGIYSVFLWNRYRMSDYQAFPTEKTFITGDDTKFIQLCVLKAYADTVMITTKPTETYIPHVEVNNVNVLIGDSPLTEGQSISNSQEIEVFKGENTIDTTLYNKPVMEIEYE